MSHLVVRTLGIAAIGLGLSWLFLTGSSPLSNWLSSQPHITNVVSAINVPVMLFALDGVPGARPPSASAVASVAAVQWLVYGFVPAWLWCKLRPDTSSRPTPVRGAVQIER
jgi:hypothetical protein